MVKHSCRNQQQQQYLDNPAPVVEKQRKTLSNESSSSTITGETVSHHYSYISNLFVDL